jgi:PAS domain S-box-containing protein
VDITEMKKARDLFQQQGAIIEQSFDGILVADLDGFARYANPAWMSMHGYPGNDLSGRHLRFFHSEEQYRNDFIPFYEELLAREACRRRVGCMRKGGEEFMTLTSAFILKDRSGAPAAIVSIVRDISEELRMGARVNQMQKMEVVGGLAGGVAHDLNNMLTPVLGYAELVLLDLDKGDRHYEKIRQIMTAADRAQGLTRQLLAFGRRQVLDMKALNLCEVVRSLPPMVRRTIREDIEIRIAGDDPAATALVDAGQIGRIVMNIVLNAQDAMPNGGTITIETSAASLAAGAEQLSQGMEPGEYVLLSFSDTGTGMCKEVLERIFEPFFTTKQQGKGTGLGLASVYGIVTQPGPRDLCTCCSPASSCPA